MVVAKLYSSSKNFNKISAFLENQENIINEIKKKKIHLINYIKKFLKEIKNLKF